jgi:hypothetical protein
LDRNDALRQIRQVLSFPVLIAALVAAHRRPGMEV